MSVLTTHVGSLPRDEKLLAANNQLAAGELSQADFQAVLESSVQAVIARQKQLGLDFINEGEYGHITSGPVDYAAWWNYSFHRLGGLALDADDRWSADQEIVRSTPGNPRLTCFSDRRDRSLFRDAYEDPSSGIMTGRKNVPTPRIVGPLIYTGQQATQRDIALLVQGLQANNIPVSQGFVAALSPGSCARIRNEYYQTEEEVIWACAAAMREEYKLITDAGLTVQIDDPSVGEAWDQINPEPSVADYRKFIRIRIDALNWALADIPAAQTRFHVCWGSWHGPHTTDVPFADIVEEVLRVDAGGYSFEASSPRHAHEWRVWQEHKLPDDKVLLPGVVCHSTNIVEHPQLVADRLQNFINLVGKERVIASTDCGLGGRIHPQIAWAKLAALTEGAQLV